MRLFVNLLFGYLLAAVVIFAAPAPRPQEIDETYFQSLPTPSEEGAPLGPGNAQLSLDIQIGKY